MTDHFNAISYSIENDDLPGFEVLIQTFTNLDLNNNELLLAFSIIIKKIFQSKRKIFIQTLYRFIDNYINMSNVSYLVRLIRHKGLTDEELMYVISSLGDKSQYELLSDIIESGDNGEDNVFGISRLLKIYGDVNFETCQYLQVKAEEHCMTKIQTFLCEYSKHVAELELIYSETPNYIVHIDDLENVKMAVLEKYSLGNIDNVTDDILKRNVVCDEITQIFGPPNSLVPNLEDSDSMCCKLGACRMFVCNHVCDDDIEDDYGDDEDWFNGHCDICFKMIKQREYSVRIPNIDGGWIGCFCSFNCAREHINGNNVADILFKDIDKQETYSGIILSVLNELESHFDRIKIFVQKDSDDKGDDDDENDGE